MGEREEREQLEKERKEKEEKAAAWRKQREEDYGNQEHPGFDKVIDYFPERRSLKKQEEKIVIKPSALAEKFQTKSATPPSKPSKPVWDPMAPAEAPAETTTETTTESTDDVAETTEADQ